jgi:hypothetical protein
VYYTQLLRITNGLKWLAIVLASILALIVSIGGANGAFSLHAHGSPDEGGAPLPALFAIAGIAASIFASFFARTLSEENESHLPVAWTKPVSRVRYALTVMGVDALGIVTAFALTMLAIVSLFAIFGVTRFILVTPDSGVQLLRFLALPFAFYGLMTALTASFGKAGRGLIGSFWGASLALGLLGAADFPRPWKAILAAINLVNPMSYASYSYSSGHETTHIFAGSNSVSIQAAAVSIEFAILLLLAVAGLTAGVLLWRRVEA